MDDTPTPTASDRQTVAELVRAHREAAGLTLAALAEAAGTTKSYLSMIENRRTAPPSAKVIAGLERALKIEDDRLRAAAAWEQTPPSVRARVKKLEAQAAGGFGRDLDAMLRSGELRALAGGGPGVERAPQSMERLGGEAASRSGSTAHPPRSTTDPTPRQVPLINKVAAGYPTDFTDLDYPASVADDYITPPPGLNTGDPDAFAATVCGDSMEPDFKEGDIVVFSPLADVTDGCDCFVRLEPEHETTFKRVFLDEAAGRITLHPLNGKYEPRTLPREQVAGMYRAVARFTRL